MLTKLQNMIKRAVLTLTGNDSGSYPTAQCQYYGKTTNAEVVYPYGLSANAPIGSQLLLFSVMAQEENLAGIASAPFARFKNLKSGEVVIGNPVTGSYVKFAENGDIEVVSKGGLTATIEGAAQITAGSAQVTAGSIKLVGNVEVTGSLLINGTVTSIGIADFGGPGAKAIARVGDKIMVGGVEGEITTGGTSKST